MVFKLRNEDAVKLNSDELLIEAFNSYCLHIEKGSTKESWYFEKDGKSICTHQTIEKYIDSRSDVLCSSQYNSSVAKGIKRWSGVVADSAQGVNRKANTASLQMYMRNVYGWDTKGDVENKAAEEKRAELKVFAQESQAAREQHSCKSTDRSDSLDSIIPPLA